MSAPCAVEIEIADAHTNKMRAKRFIAIITYLYIVIGSLRPESNGIFQFPNRTIVVTPENPQRFVSEVESQRAAA
jgi:hypothetical protein